MRTTIRGQIAKPNAAGLPGFRFHDLRHMTPRTRSPRKCRLRSPQTRPVSRRYASRVAPTRRTHRNANDFDDGRQACHADRHVCAGSLTWTVVEVYARESREFDSEISPRSKLLIRRDSGSDGMSRFVDDVLRRLTPAVRPGAATPTCHATAARISDSSLKGSIPLARQLLRPCLTSSSRRGARSSWTAVSILEYNVSAT